MKLLKWLAPLALVLGLSSADAQTWSKLNTGINRGVTPNIIGIDIGTSATNFIPIGYVASGTFTPAGVDSSSLLSFGADPSGVSSSSSAINAALVTGRRLRIPCGTYLIDAPIFIPSSTDILGDGPCTVLKISATLATDTSTPFGVLRHVFTNNNYSAGNVDIYIHDMSIDNTAGPTTGAHIHTLGFYKVTRAGVWNLTITSAAGRVMDDGIAFVASNGYFVRNNKIYGTINACIDQWEGVTDFDISGNLCDGLNLANYGIVVSGFGTNAAPFTSQRGSISNNVVKNFPGVGIWLQGGWNGVSGGGATYGLVKNIEVVGNNISSVNGYHGIDLTDASNNSIVANTLENIGRNAVIVSSENSGASTNNVIATNAISSCNAAAGGEACILLTPYAHYNTLSDNTIAGTAQTYSIVINGGATGNVIRGGVTPVGTIGDVSNGGTATQLQIGNAFVTSPTFRSLTGYVKGNGASAATAASTIPTTDLSGLGTGVATALGNATNASGGLLGYGSSIGLHANLSEGAYRVLNLNLNATGDTSVPITMPVGATRYVVFAIRVSNSTGNLPNGTGTLGAYTGAGRTGVTLANQQALDTLITSQADATAGNVNALALAAANTQSFTATTLYLNVQTAQGAAAAIDVAIVLRFY